MFIVDFGRTTISMVRGSISLQMGTIIKGTFIRVQGMGKEGTFGVIKAVTKEIGRVTRCTGMVSIRRQRERLPKGGLKMTSMLVEMFEKDCHDILSYVLRI
jgi:hypothetical protein